MICAVRLASVCNVVAPYRDLNFSAMDTKTNRNSYAIYRMVSFSMTLTTPNPDFKGTPLFDV